MHNYSDEQKNLFYLTIVKLEKEGDRIRIILDSDPKIGISGADRKLFSDPKAEFAQNGYYRWAAGGMLNIFRQGKSQKIVLALRDSGAPSFGGYLTLASGLSASFAEFFNPIRLAVREGLEETACAVDGKIIIPRFSEDYEEISWNVFEFQRRRLENLSKTISPEPLYVPAVLKGGGTTVEIVQGGRVSQSSGIVNIDLLTRGIDFLKILKIDLPKGNSTLFVDCEDSPRGPLNRELVVFELDDISEKELVVFDLYGISKEKEEENRPLKIKGASQIFQGGISKEADPEKYYPVTPPLEAVLRAL